MRPFALVLLALTGLLLAQSGPASACACCTNTAHRRVEVEKFTPAIAEELARLRFRPEAKLALGEGYRDAIIGLDEPDEDYSVTVTRSQTRIAFALRDRKGRSGTLSLAAPKTISIFEVDPRDEPETGHGPRLYKEWKLTTAITGDGIFRASAGAGRRITLVLHGRGNACTDATDFRHWTLLVHGTGTAPYTFHGELLPPQ